MGQRFVLTVDQETATTLVEGSGQLLAVEPQPATPPTSATVGAIRVDFGGSGPFTSTATVPPGALVLSVYGYVVTPGAPGSTLEVGQPGDPTRFYPSLPVDVAGAFDVPSLGPATPDPRPVVVTVSPGAGCGGLVVVLWAIPQT